MTFFFLSSYQHSFTLLIYIAIPFSDLEESLNNTFVRVLMQEKHRKEHFQNCLWVAGYSQC